MTPAPSRPSHPPTISARRGIWRKSSLPLAERFQSGAIGKLSAHTLRRCPPHETNTVCVGRGPPACPLPATRGRPAGTELEDGTIGGCLSHSSRSFGPSLQPAGVTLPHRHRHSVVAWARSHAVAIDQSPSGLWIVSCLWWLVWHIDNLWVVEHRRLMKTHTMY